MRKRTKSWQIFFAILLFTDGFVVNAQSNWTQRGPRPDRENFRQNPRQLSWTQKQNDALQSEVMCQLFEVMNNGHSKSAQLERQQRSLEQLEENIKMEEDSMRSKREQEQALEHQYNTALNACNAKIKAMWQPCNECITNKCVSHYRNTCDQTPVEPPEENQEEIIPPCRRRPGNQGCGGRKIVPSQPESPPDDSSMRITVNGELVPDMETAITKIRNTMSNVITPPCETGSKFSQFNSVINSQSSPKPSNSQRRVVNYHSSSTGGGKPSLSPNMQSGMNIGQMLLEQSEKVGANDKVNITIGINGEQKHFDNFDELFENDEIMNNLNSFNQNFEAFKQTLPNMASSSHVAQSSSRRPSSSSSSHSSFSKTSSSGNGGSKITHTSKVIQITSSSGSQSQRSQNSQSNMQSSFQSSSSSKPIVQSGCQEQPSCSGGGCRQSPEQAGGLVNSAVQGNNGGCSTFQSTSIGGNGGEDLFANVQSQLNRMLNGGSGQFSYSKTTSGPSGSSNNRQVQFSSTSSNGQPASGLSQEIVNKGQFSDDGKTFTYSWTSQGDSMPEVNLEEVMSLLSSRTGRQRASSPNGRCRSSRCTRNSKYELGRRRRYSSDKNRRAVSQCAIEQAAREAEERAEQEQARRMSALAAQGGYKSACQMLSAQYGEDQMNQMVNQMIQTLKDKISRAREICTQNGTCGNTQVDITVSGQASSDCGKQPDSPCNSNQESNEQRETNIESTASRNSDSTLGNISARLQKWSQSFSGSWSSNSEKTNGGSHSIRIESSSSNSQRPSVSQGSIEINGELSQDSNQNSNQYREFNGQFDQNSNQNSNQNRETNVDITVGSESRNDQETDCSQSQDSIEQLVPGESRGGCKSCTRCNNQNPEEQSEPQTENPAEALTTESAIIPDIIPTDDPSERDEYDYDSNGPNSYESELANDTYSSENYPVPFPNPDVDNPGESDYSNVQVAAWSQFWSEWSSCDVPCSQGGEPGSQTRTRQCVYEDESEAMIGTGSCTHGNDVTYRNCEPTPPPCSKWASWGFWSQCSQTCGAGVRNRQRSCLYGGQCPGSNMEEENCIDGRRPVCPEWSSWKIGVMCSVTCGVGMSNQYRTCVNGQIGEEGCQGPAAKHSQCDTQTECPVWGFWTEWSECGVTCGTSQVTRTRECINGNVGDLGCEGKAEEAKVCMAAQRHCPYWSAWGQFSTCSVSCGTGEQSRERECINGEPGDVGCEGDEIEIGDCTARRARCPSWDFWARWSSCSVSCGTGLKTRERECVDGVVGEEGCIGTDQERMECYGTVRRECEYWGDWSSWYPCSVTCGQGSTERDRPCINGNPGDQGCQGSPDESQFCEMQDCEEFVEYEGDDDLDTDISKICPDILSPAEVEDSTDETDEYIGEERPEIPPAYEDEVVVPHRNFSCDEIFNQESEACTELFTDSCVACDNDLDSVCPETTSIKARMDALRKEMKDSLKKVEFYASRKRARQSDLLKIHNEIAQNYDWAQQITQQIIGSPQSSKNFIAACDIDKVSVLPEPYRTGSVINVVAKMNIPPYASISIDVTVNGDCCSSRETMTRTRREIGTKVLDHIKKVTQRRRRH